MKNVTVTLDEEVAHWARVYAAQHDMSVSRLLGQMLRELMEKEEGYEKAMKDYFSVSARPLKTRGKYPSRDELHDRKNLR